MQGRGALRTAAVAGLAALALGAGALASTGNDSAPPPAGSPVGGPGEATTTLAAAQERLRDVPGDWVTWAELGAAYVVEAARSADPSNYERARGALARSLEIRPQDNSVAVTGQAQLAAALHDFPAALALADRALVLNDFSSTAYGVRADALIELGRYDEATDTVQRMLDLRPGVPSFTRASYIYELRGETDAARQALQRAVEDTLSPADLAFAHYYLGELAWNAGDLDTADREYEAGLASDPSYLQLVAGKAKVAAARGQIEAAIRSYGSVVDRLPLPQYAAELGDLLASQGRAAEADEQFAVVRATQRLLADSGVDVDLELALFDADHGQEADALRQARAAYAVRPDNVFVRDALAWALHVNDRDEEALPHARAAAAGGLRSAQFAYHRGMIEAAVSRDDAAENSLAQALELNPHFSPVHAPRAKAELDRLRRA